jgi:hypothetical protein
VDGESRYDIFDVWLSALELAFRERGVRTERGWAERPEPGLAGPGLSLGFNMTRAWSIRNLDVYHVAWLVDHPAFAADLFFPQIKRIPVNLERCLISVVDEGRLDFAQKVFGLPHACLLPHPCVAPVVEPDNWGGRSPVMLMFGSIVNPALVKTGLQQEARHLWPVIEPFMGDLPEAAVNQLDQLVWSAVSAAIPNKAQAIMLMNAFFPQIDIYHRNALRLKMLRLIRTHEIHVYGHGAWAELELPPNVRVFPSVPYQQALTLMRQHRWVLNHAPTLSRGTHERVLDAAASGCGVITTYSSYLEREFTVHGSICFVATDSLSLDAEIAELKAWPDWPGRVAATQSVIKRRHRIEHRVDDLIKALQDRWPAAFA